MCTAATRNSSSTGDGSRENRPNQGMDNIVCDGEKFIFRYLYVVSVCQVNEGNVCGCTLDLEVDIYRAVINS